MNSDELALKRRAHDAAEYEIARFRTGYVDANPIRNTTDRILANHIINAIIPLVLEHAAKVAEAQRYSDRIVQASYVDGDTGPERFNEGVNDAAAAIRAEVQHDAG